MWVDAATFKTGKDRLFGGACALALLLSVVPTLWHPGLGAALAGWAAAALLAAAASCIHRRAIASRGNYFLAWSLSSMTIRMGLILGLLAAVRAAQPPAFTPFATALVLSYLAFLYAEVARLHLES